MFGQTMITADVEKLKVSVDCHDATGVAPDLRVEKKRPNAEVFVLEAAVRSTVLAYALLELTLCRWAQN